MKEGKTILGHLVWKTRTSRDIALSIMDHGANINHQDHVRIVVLGFLF